MNVKFSEETIDRIVNQEFNCIDSDKSNFIEYKEYAASIKKKLKELEVDIDDAAIEAQMKSIDKDGDSKISREEYKAYFKILLGIQ